MTLRHDSTRFSLVIALLMFLLPSMRAQTPQGPEPKTKKPVPARAQGTNAHEMTSGDVEAFLDGLITMQLAREDIAGAVVVVVKDGKVLLGKGYGYSDVAKRTPVSVATIFRPGSISKLFTWTAVMQLVEQGKLDLDRDVNDYLDFQIPHTYGRPVTLRNLMTHSAGFEEVVKGLEVEKVADLTPLGTYLRHNVPRQIHAPGAVPAYSNYGADLAGYIVERVSGRPFESYIEDYIFHPLGMKTATFRQPTPDRLQPLMSQGYKVASQPAEPFELLTPEPAPSGSLALAATDIAPFIVAHLQDGQYQGVQILRPETARLMHARQFTMHPDVDGMALGFYEENRNGHKIIGHGGDLAYFHSDLHLVTDAGVGFFISYNSSGTGDTDPRAFVWEQFMDRYFPFSPSNAPGVTDAAKREAQQAAGSYVASRREETTVLSFLWYALVGKTVSVDPDGTLKMDGMDRTDGQPKRWRPIGNMTFGEVGGQNKLILLPDRGLLVGTDPVEVFERVSWTRSKPFLQTVLGFVIAMFGLTLLIWPVAAIVRKHYGLRLTLLPQQSRLRIAVKLTCALCLLFLVAVVAILAYSMQHLTVFQAKNDVWIRMLQLVAALGVLGTVPVAYSAYTSWRVGGWWSRVYTTGLTVACVAFAWFVVSFHLLSWNLAY